MFDPAHVSNCRINVSGTRRGPIPLHIYVGYALSKYEGGEQNHVALTAMMEGIKKYQKNPFVRPSGGILEIWRAGQASLGYLAANDPAGTGNATLVLVPSLINKSYILDLLPERSFMRWLAQQGINVCLLDWGEPCRDEKMADFDGLIEKRLVPALSHVRKQTQGPLYVLGYCMGGTILASAATMLEGLVDGVIFLASPWDFEAGDRRMTDYVRAFSPSAMQVIGEKGYLPSDWIQSLFAALNAENAMHKFAKFAGMAADSKGSRLFVAVEDWLNDGLDLPGAVAQACICDWYGQNSLIKQVTSANRTMRNLIITSQKDRLVPRESAQALKEHLPQADVLVTDAGHIGMMTGRQAEQFVWKPIREWILN